MAAFKSERPISRRNVDFGRTWKGAEKFANRVREYHSEPIVIEELRKEGISLLSLKDHKFEMVAKFHFFRRQLLRSGCGTINLDETLLGFTISSKTSTQSEHNEARRILGHLPETFSKVSAIVAWSQGSSACVSSHLYGERLETLTGGELFEKEQRRPNFTYAVTPVPQEEVYSSLDDITKLFCEKFVKGDY